MTRYDYALGWRVLGCGEGIAEARATTAMASDFLIDLWAERQRAALRGFGRMIDRITESDQSN